MARVLVVLTLCSVIFVSLQRPASALEEGDICLTPSGGHPAWECKLFQNCPSAVKLIKERKPPPVSWRCGFKGNDSIVCCPPYEIADWSSDEPLQSVFKVDDAPVSAASPSTSTTATDAISTDVPPAEDSAPTTEEPTSNTLVPSVDQSNAAAASDVCLRISENNPWSCRSLLDCPVARRLVDKNIEPPKNFYCDCPSALCVCCPPHDITDWTNFEPPAKINISAVLSSRFGDLHRTNNKEVSKALAKCQEYAEFYFAGNLSRYDAVAVGGQPAKPKEFPHMALLGYGEPSVYLCGGTLVSERFVLTAAHCQKSEQYGPVRTVLLGDFDVKSYSDDANPRNHSVLRKYVHPDYKPESLYHDIMLLELDKDVKFSEYVFPVCLQMDKLIPESTGIVTGWGRTEPLGPPSNVLQKVEIPFVSHKDCNKALRNYVGTRQLELGVLDSIQICAGAEDGKDSCKGDSGGPLQVRLVEKVYMQVAVVSSGNIFCGTAGEPGVYTRVSAYLPWIESIVWPESPRNSSNLVAAETREKLCRKNWSSLHLSSTAPEQ